MPALLTVSTGANRTSRFVPTIWISSLTCGVIAAVTFLAFPQLDLLVSRAFYAGDGTFVGQSLGWVRSLRAAFVIAFWLCAAGAVVGLWMTRDRVRAWLRLTFAQWLFLTICLAMGPGIVTNVILKDHWGRARPKQIVEFGGHKAFTPPLIPANQCASNCSFVSGEPASVFLPFYAAAFVVPQWSVLLVGMGTLLGLANGAVRVSQGAHFLSDVIFAGVFMALTPVLVYRVMFRRIPTGSAPSAQG